MYGCSSYNGLVQKDTSVEQTWAKVQTQYQRRADLMPNLTPENIQKFQAAQDQLSGSLSRLLAVAENYPQLKATANFSELQAQLEGTENRIAVARNDFNTVVGDYNQSVRSFPNNIFAGIFGFQRKGFFEASQGAQNAPTVQF